MKLEEYYLLYKRLFEINLQDHIAKYFVNKKNSNFFALTRKMMMLK